MMIGVVHEFSKRIEKKLLYTSSENADFGDINEAIIVFYCNNIIIVHQSVSITMKM